MEYKNKDYFEFIDSIRETNQVNIFETPKLLRKQFDLTKQQSYQIFKNWITNYEKIKI